MLVVDHETPSLALHACMPRCCASAFACDPLQFHTACLLTALHRFANHSMVEANFSMTHDDEAGADGVFSVTPSKCVHCAAPFVYVGAGGGGETWQLPAMLTGLAGVLMAGFLNPV